MYVVTEIKTRETFVGFDCNSCLIIDGSRYKDDLSLVYNVCEKYAIIEIYSEINRDITKGLFSTENRTLLWKKDDKNFKEYLIDTTDYEEEYIKDYDTFENSIYICPNYKCNGYKSEKNEEQDLIYIDIAEYRNKTNYNITNNDECTSLTIEKAKELIKALTEIIEYAVS